MQKKIKDFEQVCELTQKLRTLSSLMQGHALIEENAEENDYEKIINLVHSAKITSNLAEKAFTSEMNFKTLCIQSYFLLFSFYDFNEVIKKQKKQIILFVKNFIPFRKRMFHRVLAYLKRGFIML